MFKKVAVVLVYVLMSLVCVCGCGSGIVTLSTEEIEADVQSRDMFDGYDLAISKFEIIKRQTNIEDKEDIVYVHLEGKNESIKATRNYKLVYVLYNEGWLLEDMESYVDDGFQDETMPLYEMEESYVPVFFSNFAGANKGELFIPFILVNTGSVQGEIEQIVKEPFRNTYRQVNVYEYPFCKETVEIIGDFVYDGTTWEASDTCETSISLNKEALIGTWQGIAADKSIEVVISEPNQEDKLWCNVYYTFWNNSRVAWADDIEPSYANQQIVIFPVEAYQIVIRPDGLFCKDVLLQKVE